MMQSLCEVFSFSTCSPTLAIVFFILAILVGMKGSLSVVLICTSLMANYVEHLVCLLAIYVIFEEIPV